jgi:hypothetical protein
MKIKLLNWTFEKLHPAPLLTKEADAGMAIDMEVEHAGNECGICGKSFNVARKCRSSVQLFYGGDLGVMFSWKLCGKCTHDVECSRETIPDCLKHEAEKTCEELLLATSKPEV